VERFAFIPILAWAGGDGLQSWFPTSSMTGTCHENAWHSFAVRVFLLPFQSGFPPGPPAWSDSPATRF